jgi:hypothetical protein
VVHEQPDAGVQSGLRELDRTDVVLGDRDPRPTIRRAVVEEIRKRSPVGDDARSPRRERAVDDAVRGDDAGKEQLRDDLNDARAADARDASSRRRVGEPRFVRPGIAADDPEPRLERVPIDPHPLDRAGSRALAAADLGALEGGTRRRRCGEQEVAVAENDLGVRAHVDDELDRLGFVGGLGEDHAGRVGPDVTRDTGQHVDTRAGMRPQVELRGADPHRPVGRQRERRRAKRDRVDPEHEVVHDRVADEGELEDLVAGDSGLHRERGHEPVERGPDCRRHLAGALWVHHRVRDTAHEVLTEPDLGVHDAVAGENLAVGQVGEMARDRRRADVDRDAERPVVKPGPDGDDVAAVMDGHGRRPLAGLERRLQCPHYCQVGLEVRQAPFPLERVLEPDEVAGRRGELGRRDLDVVEPDDRVDVEVPNVEALADDLAIDLALGRDVDDGVAANVGRAREAAAFGEALLGPVGRFDGIERREVLRARLDAVLREAANALLDLASTADAAPAADRVDIDSERPRGIEDGRLGRHAPTPARRREDDEGIGAGHVGSAGPGPARRRLTRLPPPSPSAGATRNVRIQRDASWSLPSRTSAAITACFTPGAIGFVIADVRPLAIAIAR